jgi:hypothetical protein
LELYVPLECKKAIYCQDGKTRHFLIDVVSTIKLLIVLALQIQREKPDIIGFEEVREGIHVGNQLLHLKELLPGVCCTARGVSPCVYNGIC